MKADDGLSMRRKYTIKTITSDGQETTQTFTSKREAKLYCQQTGLRPERLDVEITVQGGGAIQSERFVKEARSYDA